MAMRESKNPVYHVPADGGNHTLGSILRRWQVGQSWSEVRRLLRSRRVMVNGNLCGEESRRLKPGDVVKLLPHAAPAPPREDDVRVWHLDAHLVVVEKPAGMTSIRHPEERFWPARRRQLQPTLDELLPRIVARLESHGGRRQPPRPLRAVHRLDRDTSGLMVFARNVKAERHLGEQFRRHSIERVYWALAAGRVATQTIDARLVADRGDRRRGIARHAHEGQAAVTHVRSMESLPGCTLVECRLETGRTHQIRIHLAAQGHPVLGDRVYGPPPTGPRQRNLPAPPRLALHAARLGLVHPHSGQRMQFDMPLPADLQRFLDQLRRSPDRAD